MAIRKTQRQEKKTAQVVLPPELVTSLESLHKTVNPLVSNFSSDHAKMEKIWAQANEPLREVIRETVYCFSGSRALALRWQYRCAELLKQVEDDRLSGGAVYGKKAAQMIRKFFGWRQEEFDAAMRMAIAFTREEIKQLGSVQTGAGQPFHYYHADLLARVYDRAAKRQLLQSLLTENWSTMELDRRVNEVNKEIRKQSDFRGRTLSIPRTVEAVIEQQNDLAQEFLIRSEKVWRQPAHSLLSKARDLTPAECSAQLVERVNAHAGRLGELARDAQLHQAEALQACELLTEKLARNQPGSETSTPKTKEQ
jgi:hypothetical protein